MDSSNMAPKRTVQSTIKSLADAICSRERFAQDAGRKLYRYEAGVYRPKAEEFIKRRVKQLCEQWELTDWTPRLAESVVEWIRVDSPELWQRPPMDLLNLQNGLLDIRERRLLPHSPEHLSPIQLPVNYDPDATCPAIEKFVEQTFPEDATELAWEIIAWLMMPNTAFQKAVLFLGEGGNGKSRWLALVRSFLGQQNTTSLSLHALESNRFSVARIMGKLANICADLPSEHLAGTSVFKALTDGGSEMITGEYKFKGSFEFMPFARLLFSANHPPRSADASQAFFDRWLAIPFDRRFRGADGEVSADVLDKRLAQPQELSGLLNKALDVLPRLMKQGRFSEPASIKAALDEFRSTTDPMAVWLDNATVDDPNAIVPKQALRAAYSAECERRGSPALSDKAFTQRLLQMRPRVEKKQRTVNGKVTWCFCGIGLA